MYLYHKNSWDLTNFLLTIDNCIQLAMIFTIDLIWNNQFYDRYLILNLEHGYIEWYWDIY